ncbi:MAG TPA: hypothetical protein VIL30_14410 [Ramlibacter sp.]|jgi:ActR/RegA family two-component response regulator
MNKPFLPPTAAEQLLTACTEFNLSAHDVSRLYVRAAFRASGRNVSETARRTGMHRRTVQRILAAEKPAPKHKQVTL